MHWTSQLEFPALYIHIASLILVVAYLVRDPIGLRGLVALGQLFFVLFYINQTPTPIWEAIFWNGLIMSTNIFMIAVLAREKSLARLTADEKALYPLFETLTPGEFRRILKSAEWGSTAQKKEIIVYGEQPDHVYFLIDGTGHLARPERSIALRAGMFLGEIAFVLNRGATATVVLDGGSRYIRWENNTLRRLMRNNHRVDIAFRGLFNRDLALKVALG